MKQVKGVCGERLERFTVPKTKIKSK